MKTFLFGLFLTSLLFAFKVDTPKKIIFFGDSITQAGVNPGGYITMLKDMYAKAGNTSELIGAGIGGNKVYDLFLRMEDDVLSKKPDVVVIYVGVNDVWHKASYGTGTDADKFTKFYTALIKKMQSQGIKLILTTPAAIGEKNDHSNQQDGDLNQYSKIIRDLAKEHKCGLVDLRKEFLAYNLANNPENKGQGILTTDRVHLNEAGNKFVAELMFRELMK
ncbi:SGNH/GDSL hydrolase family protein [Lacihabitans sp. CS3-21]|uniref:SGNH/GDSL hydrolase family protein n=1 Tax=Lacihabitans sp. CS3-21 TaxID=2487332 RepID=UPI0020CFDDBD|nr:SGNH/GDSL hydrolase family protein [Lacihabitans sp. CS3-21]MCP9745461.1 G-D-S-L family lipolytic protein [Lacihabitans sp. CS3-21]